MSDAAKLQRNLQLSRRSGRDQPTAPMRYEGSVKHKEPWTAGMPEHVDFAESASGFSRLPPAAVADPLHEALAGASKHLLSRAPASERFRKLRKRIAVRRQLLWPLGDNYLAGSVQHGSEIDNRVPVDRVGAVRLDPRACAESSTGRAGRRDIRQNVSTRP